MAEVIKTYRQSVPALRFIGRMYKDEDRTDGSFGRQWGQWHSEGLFKAIEENCPLGDFEDSDAFIGLMRWKEGEPFQYWIGMFCAPDAPVPAGYASVDFPSSHWGIGWLYGGEDSLFMQEDKCAKSCEEQGYKIISDERNAYWFFERYACPRFTTPDEKGNIILDIGHFILSELEK